MSYFNYKDFDYESFGKIIKYHRTAHKLSQEKLSELCGISPSHMSHIETGTGNVGLQTLVKLANALDVTMDELFVSNVDASNRIVYNKEISELLKDCDYPKRKFIMTMIKNIVNGLDDYTADITKQD